AQRLQALEELAREQLLDGGLTHGRGWVSWVGRDRWPRGPVPPPDNNFRTWAGRPCHVGLVSARSQDSTQGRIPRLTGQKLWVMGKIISPTCVSAPGTPRRAAARWSRRRPAPQ